MFKIKGGKVLIIQQGDVPLVPVETKIGEGTNLAKGGRAVLALGEMTGHAHVINFDETQGQRVRLVRDKDVLEMLRRELVDKGILDADADVVDAALEVEGETPVSLTHEEHAPHSISPGRYAVLSQREYSPEEIHRVAD